MEYIVNKVLQFSLWVLGTEVVTALAGMMIIL